MIFETHIPSLPLSKCIASIVNNDGCSTNHTFKKLLLDGSVYLLINFKDALEITNKNARCFFLQIND